MGLGYIILPPGGLPAPTQDGIDWGSIIGQGISTAPEIIRASRGLPGAYAYPYGQQGGYPGRDAQFAGRFGGSSIFGTLDTSDLIKWGAILLVGLIVFKKALK